MNTSQKLSKALKTAELQPSRRDKILVDEQHFKKSGIPCVRYLTRPNYSYL